jgi:hypothetical protein
MNITNITIISPSCFSRIDNGSPIKRISILVDFKPSRQQSGQILHGVEPWRTGCCTKSGEECRHSPRVGRFPWSCYGGEIVRPLKDWLNFEHTMFRNCTSSEVFFRWRHQNSFALGFSSLGKQGYCEFSSDRHLFDQCMSYFWNPWACPSFSFLVLSFLYILPIFAVSFAMYPTEWPNVAASLLFPSTSP